MLKPLVPKAKEKIDHYTQSKIDMVNQIQQALDKGTDLSQIKVHLEQLKTSLRADQDRFKRDL